jgi:hypothetical protein
MNFWLLLLVSGIVGTSVMTAFLLVPRWLGWANVDVIRAGGALVVGGLNRGAFPVGLAIHAALGIVFAFLYAAFLHYSALPFNALTGLLLGSIHGVVVMLLVSILIMEHHPVARYHERGPATGLAQLAAHMLYGLTIGLIMGISRQ